MGLLLLVALSGIVLGWALAAAGICPVVKRIWTPSWVLVSGGWCFLGMAIFYRVIDLNGARRWAFPLIVIGMNSIAAYVMDHLFTSFIRDTWKTHLGAKTFEFFGSAYAPFLLGTCVVGTMWLLLYAMWRKKIFLRI
jgi:predicted acyltransferase